MFGRAIGANQAISHPLARAYCQLSAASTLVRSAAHFSTRAFPRVSGQTWRSTLPPKPRTRPRTRRCRHWAVWPSRGEYHVERLFSDATYLPSRACEPGNDAELRGPRCARATAFVLGRTRDEDLRTDIGESWSEHSIFDCGHASHDAVVGPYGLLTPRHRTAVVAAKAHARSGKSEGQSDSESYPMMTRRPGAALGRSKSRARHGVVPRAAAGYGEPMSTGILPRATSDFG